MGTDFQCHLAISEYIYFTVSPFASLCSGLITCYKLSKEKNLLNWTTGLHELSQVSGRTPPAPSLLCFSTTLTPSARWLLRGAGFHTQQFSGSQLGVRQPGLTSDALSKEAASDPKGSGAQFPDHATPTSDLGRHVPDRPLWSGGSPGPLLELGHLLGTAHRIQGKGCNLLLLASYEGYFKGHNEQPDGGATLGRDGSGSGPPGSSVKLLFDFLVLRCMGTTD